MYIFRAMLAIVFICSSSVTYGQDSNKSLAVIVNSGVPQESVSEEELGQILLGDTRFWDGGGLITLLIQAPVSWERDTVLGKIMQMSEPQYRQFWISKVFRAEVASGPKVVLSNEMAGILVSKIPGAMAFVDDGEIPMDTKVLKVNGLLPGESGYPLNF